MAERLAITALLALCMATLFGWFELGQQRRSRSAAAPVAPLSSTSSQWSPAIALLVGLAAGLAAQSWFHQGSAIAGGDIPPPDGVAWLSRIFSPWTWSGLNLGGPSALEQQLPWAAVLGSIHALGGSAELAQRVWLTLLFSGAAMAAYALLRQLELRPLASALGATIYVLNPYVLSNVSVNPVYLAELVLLAALPAVVLAASKRRLSTIAGALLLAGSAPLLGYVYENPPLAGTILLITLTVPLLAAFLWGRSHAGRAVRCLAIGLPLLLALSAYWVVPSIVQLGSIVTNDLSTLSSWAWTEGRATVRNAFWLNTAWGWKFSEYFPFNTAYDRLPLSILRFLLPSLAFAALALAGSKHDKVDQPQRRYRLSLVVAVATLGLFVVFISTGTNPPGSALFNVLYQLPLGWLLREPGKFLILGGLVYAVLVAVLLQALFEGSHGVQRPGAFRARRPLQIGITALVAATVMIVGFPLLTGAVAPDQRGFLPSTHVRMPPYWMDMADFVNRAPSQGGLLVLPPDDFYQMPYQWGYYGTDGFIPNLISRPVLVTSGQGYIPGTHELASAVNLVSDSILAGRWKQAIGMLRTLRSPLVLVRGDIQAGFANRAIVSPNQLQISLDNALDFELLHRAGPLSLYRLKSGIQSEFRRVQGFATINSPNPDLQVLSLLPDDRHVVFSGPIAGIPLVIQAPPIAVWKQSGGTGLSVVLDEPDGWTYLLTDLNGNQTTDLGQQGLTPVVRKFTRADVSNVAGHNQLRLTILGREGLTNGDFRQGQWGPVGDCNGALAESAQPYLSSRLISETGSSTPILRLSASADSACQSRNLSWTGGPVRLSLRARHIVGAPPHLCVWETGAERCASLPSMDSGSGWITFQAVFTPDPGTTALTLFLYADASSPGTLTVNDYSNVSAIEIPGVPRFVLVGTPRSDTSSELRLIVLHDSYSPSWEASSRARHVLVDGMQNGWLVDGDHPGFRIFYSPATIIQWGFWLSVLSVILALALFLRLLGPAALKYLRQLKPIPSRSSGPDE